MKRILMLALLLATSLVMGQDVAQQQPQKPKPHGFKARLCAMSTAPDSPAFDSCMTRGFGKPRPSQTAQQAAPPQAKLQEPIAAKAAPAQAKPQEPIDAKAAPAQAKLEEPISAKDTPAQAKPQQPIAAKAAPAQTKLEEPISAKDTPAQAKLQEPIAAKDTPAQVKRQEPIAKDTQVEAKTCIEYMTTSSGAQTCLRRRGDQDEQ